MKMRIFTIKVKRHQDVVYVRVYGKSDRGQPALLGHASAIAAGDGKATSVRLWTELEALSKK